MPEFDSRSWWTPEPDPPEHQLPDDLRAADPFAARDCGWVSQMRPFVRQFCAEGGQVFDPFCGFGSTLLAAALEGRAGHGMEVDAQRAALAAERLARHGITAPIVVGALPEAAPAAQVDLCLTNVPYFGCDWRGDATGQQLYASTDYAGYLRGLRAVFHAVRRHLRDGGFCIAMVENIVVNGRVLPQAWDLARILCSLYAMHEERMLCYQRPAQALPAGASHSNRSHEYALVFQKRRQRSDLAQAAEVLDALRAAGFAFALHGSYARWLLAPEQVPDGPGDVDLQVVGGQPQWDAITTWLQAHGFALSLWGEPCQAPVALSAVVAHHYLSAERITHDGRLLRLDLQPFH